MKKLMSFLLVLALLASCVTVLAETETTEFVCPEKNFATRIPAGASARYEKGTGLIIYTRSEAKYDLWHRTRPCLVRVSSSARIEERSVKSFTRPLSRCTICT